VCEIFVSKGLEAALNIDRESLNTAHPHTIYLARWIHSGLRQLATANKKVASFERQSRRTRIDTETQSRYEEIAQSANIRRTAGEGVIPSIEFIDEDEKNSPDTSNSVAQKYKISHIINEASPSEGWGPATSGIQKLEAIAKILSIYGVFDHLTKTEQENLLGSILGVLEVGSFDK
jgi:hypothetical protein